MKGSSVENTVKNRITVEGRDGAFGAYIARLTALPAPAVVVLHEVFGVNADIRKTCDEWPTKVSLPSRPIYSGVKSPASTSPSLPSPTGNTVFASRRPTTERRAPGTSGTPPTSWPHCRDAPAELPSSDIASAD